MYKSSLIIVSIIFINLSGQTLAYNGTCPSGCECNFISVVVDSVINSGLTSINVNNNDVNSETGTYPDIDASPLSVWVECSRLKPRLQALPPRTQLPENIFALDVTLNDIETLELIDSMDTLTWFSISGNELRTLSPETFNNVRGLRYLDLKDNNLTEIPEKVFDQLNNLEILDLSMNKLRHLTVDSFKYNVNLKKLNLAHNLMRIIHPEWFTTLVNLNELNLAGNELLTIFPETFKWTPNLESIDLSRNMLKHVPSFALKLARNLKKIKFNYNNVEIIDEDSFSQLNSLEEIEICYNAHLIEIQLRSFYNLNNLKVIKIEHNPDLSHLDAKAFIGMSYNKTNSNLEKLSLIGNRFNTLPRYSLNWCNLKELDLRENPWMCDCNLEWTRDCPSVVGNPKCATPSNLRGVILFHVEKQDFGCESDVDLSKDIMSDTTPRINFKEQAAEQARNVKFLIMIFGVLVLFFLGLAIAIVVKRSDTIRGMRMKRGSGSIYYMKTPTNNMNNNQPSLL